MTKYSVLIMIMIIFIVTGIIGSHYGYTVNGMPKGGAITPDGLLTYLWNFCFFSIDGIPLFLSLIYDVLIVLFAFMLVTEFGTAGLIAGALAGIIRFIAPSFIKKAIPVNAGYDRTK